MGQDGMRWGRVEQTVVGWGKVELDEMGWDGWDGSEWDKVG